MDLSKKSSPLISASLMAGVSVLVYLILRSAEPEVPNLLSGLCFLVAIALISATNNPSSRALLSYVRQRDNIKGLRTPYALVPIFHQAYALILILTILTLYGEASLEDDLALFVGIGLFLGFCFTAVSKDEDASLDIWNFEGFERGKFHQAWVFIWPIVTLTLTGLGVSEVQNGTIEPRALFYQAALFYAIGVPIFAKREGSRWSLKSSRYDAPRLMGMFLLLFEAFVIS